MCYVTVMVKNSNQTISMMLYKIVSLKIYELHANYDDRNAVKVGRYFHIAHHYCLWHGIKTILIESRIELRFVCVCVWNDIVNETSGRIELFDSNQMCFILHYMRFLSLSLFFSQLHLSINYICHRAECAHTHSTTELWTVIQ